MGGFVLVKLLLPTPWSVSTPEEPVFPVSVSVRLQPANAKAAAKTISVFFIFPFVFSLFRTSTGCNAGPQRTEAQLGGNPNTYGAET